VYTELDFYAKEIGGPYAESNGSRVQRSGSVGLYDCYCNAAGLCPSLRVELPRVIIILLISFAFKTPRENDVRPATVLFDRPPTTTTTKNQLNGRSVRQPFEIRTRDVASYRRFHFKRRQDARNTRKYDFQTYSRLGSSNGGRPQCHGLSLTLSRPNAGEEEGALDSDQTTGPGCEEDVPGSLLGLTRRRWSVDDPGIRPYSFWFVRLNSHDDGTACFFCSHARARWHA